MAQRDAANTSFYLPALILAIGEFLVLRPAVWLSPVIRASRPPEVASIQDGDPSMYGDLAIVKQRQNVESNMKHWDFG
jgi:hypothetical protein